MKVLELLKSGQVALLLAPIESRALRGALGEVSLGFQVDDFDNVIGCSEHEASALFRRLDGLDLERNDSITLGISDLRAIRNAHLETLRELGVEEYDTRVGVSFAEGKRIADELDRILGDGG